MKISQMHGRGWPVFSFEFFPPKSEEGARNLLATVGRHSMVHDVEVGVEQSRRQLAARPVLT